MTGGELTDWLIEIHFDGKYSKEWIIREFRRRLKAKRTKFQQRY